VEEEHFDLLLASLRGDASDMRALMEALAVKLEAALPQKAVVERKANRPFSAKKRVERISIMLDQDRYALSIVHGSAQATRTRTVGGIAIRNEQLSLEEWLTRLTEALGAEAERSEAMRIALERLLG
jgi:hypothetical protein